MVDNVARGAYGAALLMAEYFYAMERGAAAPADAGTGAGVGHACDDDDDDEAVLDAAVAYGTD